MIIEGQNISQRMYGLYIEYIYSTIASVLVIRSLVSGYIVFGIFALENRVPERNVFITSTDSR